MHNPNRDVCLCVCWYLWCALSLSDYVVQVVGDVCVQSTSQVPWLTDPVVILPPETYTETPLEKLSNVECQRPSNIQHVVVLIRPATHPWLYSNIQNDSNLCRLSW